MASEMGSQQKVSRFHSLQLRFSRRRPSSREPAQREKTRRDQYWDDRLASTPYGAGRSSPVHMLNRFSTLRVSTLWMRPTSTVNTGVSNVAGMLLVSPLDSTSNADGGEQDGLRVARDRVAARERDSLVFVVVLVVESRSRRRRRHSTRRGQGGERERSTMAACNRGRRRRRGRRYTGGACEREIEGILERKRGGGSWW